MNANLVLRNAKIGFIDSAVFIYFAEQHPKYLGITNIIFNRVKNQELQAITSPITLAECLVVPERNQDANAIQIFTKLITTGPNVKFIPIEQEVAKQASVLRAKYKISLPDAFQLAISINIKCDLFLTNDLRLKKVSEVTVMALDELEL